MHEAYVKHLIENKKLVEAVDLFSDVYTTSAEWEEQIFVFIQRNQLDVSKNRINLVK